jgi:hypothetical protein
MPQSGGDERGALRASPVFRRKLFGDIQRREASLDDPVFLSGPLPEREMGHREYFWDRPHKAG